MDFLVLFNVMIIQERSTSENDRRKCVRADSVWLHINRISQKQEFPFFGTAVRAEVHVTCRPWIKNVAHAVRRICVALSVLAKPMKESCSGRKGDRFQQQSWRLWSFRRGFFSWRLNTCCRSKRCSQPELCRKRLNGMWSQIVFFSWKCLLRPRSVTAFTC